MNQKKTPKRTKFIPHILNVSVFLTYLGYYYFLLHKLHNNPIDRVFFSASNLELVGQCLDVGIIIIVTLMLVNFISFKWLYHLNRSVLKAIGIFVIQAIIMAGFIKYFIDLGNALVETL